MSDAITSNQCVVLESISGKKVSLEIEDDGDFCIIIDDGDEAQDAILCAADVPKLRALLALPAETGADARLLGEMLAVIHGDGGHYQDEHGTAKAVADAIAKYYATRFDALCPHGMPLAENVCGPCSQGRPNSPAAETNGNAIGSTHTEMWTATLRAEITSQEAVIERMGDNHPETQGNGIMGQIRLERLELLRRLLEFEPSPPKTRGEPS